MTWHNRDHWPIAQSRRQILKQKMRGWKRGNDEAAGRPPISWFPSQNKREEEVLGPGWRLNIYAWGQLWAAGETKAQLWTPPTPTEGRQGATQTFSTDLLDLYAPLCSVLTIQSHHSHPYVRIWLDSNSPGLCQPQCMRTRRWSPWKWRAGSSAAACGSLFLCLSAAQGHQSRARLKWEHTVSAKFWFSRAYAPICLLNVVNVGSFGGGVWLIINEPKVLACPVMSDSLRPHGL